MITENGWPSCVYSDCDTSNVPGTSVSVPVQKGVPNTILKAFLADLNQYVEPYNGENDWGGWTATNSVATSNHLGGTAVDFNWNDHPMGPDCEDPTAGWQGSSLIDGDEVPAVRDLLNWYEGMVYWGADWTTPKDSMHFQMGYNTYASDGPVANCQDFINRKIRADGFSTYKRGGTPVGGATPVSTVGSTTPAPADAATALYDAVPVIDEDTAAQLVDAVTAGLAAAQCTNVKRIAMALAQWGHESDGFNTTQEYGDLSGAAYYPFIGRTWIQITWQSNYAAFGQWCVDQGLLDDPNTFVNDPTSLADLKWAGIGAAWYWTVARPTINSLCDQGDVVGVTQLINGGQNGIDDRTARYQQAIALGDELLALIETPTTPTSGGTITLADISQDDWDSLVADVKEIRAQLNGDGTFPQTGSDPAALQRLEDLYASGKPMSLLDTAAWIKHHASTHKAPTA